MIPLHVQTDLDKNPWTDLQHVKELGTITRIGRLPNGTTSGKSVVGIVITMKDGTQVMGQTSMALFEYAATALLLTENARSNPLFPHTDSAN